jgi:hypothetical protein
VDILKNAVVKESDLILSEQIFPARISLSNNHFIYFTQDRVVEGEKSYKIIVFNNNLIMKADKIVSSKIEIHACVTSKYILVSSFQSHTGSPFEFTMNNYIIEYYDTHFKKINKHAIRASNVKFDATDNCLVFPYLDVTNDNPVKELKRVKHNLVKYALKILFRISK